MDLSGSQEVSTSDVSATTSDAPSKDASKAAAEANETAPAALKKAKAAKLVLSDAAGGVEGADSKSVKPLLHQVEVDRGRDSLLTEFGKDTLRDRYLLPGESYQDLFVRVASAYADDAAHAQRLYDYISKL